MSRKLHKFQTVAEYQAYSASTEYTTPCVAVVEENNVIYYDYGNNMPQVDFSSYKGEFQESSVGGDKFGRGAITKINYIPSSITDLTNAFNGLSSLKEITCEIPNSVTDMINTFYNCTSIVNAPDIPNSVTNMFNTFYNCTSLVNAPDIPSGVTEMSYTFQGCSSLVKAPVIPSGVTSMTSTFEGCSSLVNAPVIPSGVTNMEYTFYKCTSLKEVTLLPTTPPTYIQALGSCSSLESIYVPDLAIYAYRDATGWSQFYSKLKQLSSKPIE